MKTVHAQRVEEAMDELLTVIEKPWMKRWAIVDRLRIARSRINLILRDFAQEDK